jgi:hypothetical protein
MSLSLPQPPAAALRAVLSALDSPTAVRAVRTSAMRCRPGQLAPSHPLPVHLLDPATPTAYPALTEARRTGWRFLIRDGDEVVAAADTRETPEGHAFAYFAEGPYPLSTLRALKQARLHTATTTTPYLPRLLSVPGHYMTALWLHPLLDPTGGRDLLIPLAPAPLGVTAHIPHDAEELLSLLMSISGAGLGVNLLTAAG